LAPKCLTFVVALLLYSHVIYKVYGMEDDHTPISLSRVSCHRHISPSACIHYPIGPGVHTTTLSALMAPGKIWRSARTRSPFWDGERAVVTTSSKPISRPDWFIHTHTHSPGERSFYPATQSTILPIACQLQIKHHQRAQLVWKETILGPDNLSFQLFIHDFASFSPLR
jgi:hypothetical protein